MAKRRQGCLVRNMIGKNSPEAKEQIEAVSFFCTKSESDNIKPEKEFTDLNVDIAQCP